MTRKEFEDSLKSIFNSQVFNNNFECFEALFTDDKIKIQEILNKYKKVKEKISYYLNEWDLAIDQQAKDILVGSITSDLDKK